MGIPATASGAAPLPQPAAASNDSETDSEQFVLAFARGLDIIRSFADRQRPMTMAEVSNASGIPRAAVRRMLLTLVKLGYAEADGSHFRLTAKTLQLSYAYVCADKVAALATPTLARLSEQVKTFCAVSLKQGDESMLVAIARLTQITPGLRGLPLAGASQPLYCSASGLIFLSQLSDDELEAYLGRVRFQSLTHKTLSSSAELRSVLKETREAGCAIQDRTLSPRLRSAAVPIRSARTQPLALVCVVEAELTSTEELLQTTIPAMKRAAVEISALLAA